MQASTSKSLESLRSHERQCTSVVCVIKRCSLQGAVVNHFKPILICINRLQRNAYGWAITFVSATYEYFKLSGPKLTAMWRKGTTCPSWSTTRCTCSRGTWGDWGGFLEIWSRPTKVSEWKRAEGWFSKASWMERGHFVQVPVLPHHLLQVLPVLNLDHGPDIILSACNFHIP